MTTSTEQKLIACDNCRLPLPLRLAIPGEVGSSWQCAGCGARYFGVLEIECGQNMINNVAVASEPNPRIMVGRELVAALHRRAPLDKPVMDSRRYPRKLSEELMTIMIDNTELPARAVDVSIGGVGCVVPIEIHPGREVILQFAELPGSPHCTGVVRACDPREDGYRLGIAFTR